MLPTPPGWQPERAAGDTQVRFGPDSKEVTVRPSTTCSTSCLAAVILGGFLPVCAADVLADARACATERDDARRLACYDAQLRPPSAGHSADNTFGMTPPLERKQHPESSAAKSIDKLTGRVVSVSHKLRGEAVFDLDNGQVWEQADAESGSRFQLNPGDSVTIKHGTFGSFWLSAPTVPAIRVRRVR
jgi:hypothetical protein